LLEKKEEVFQREKELCEEKRGKLLPEIKKKKIQAEKKREEIRQLYHQYRQGKMGKAEYLARKKWEGNLVEEMGIELAGLEAEDEGLQSRMSEIDTDGALLSEWLECGMDKRKLLQCLVERIDVYTGKEIGIRWSFTNRIVRTNKTLFD
jgi:hypothetical protein